MAKKGLFCVIPANAGIQSCHDKVRRCSHAQTWIPAFAGMTAAAYARATAAETSGFFDLEAIVQAPNPITHLFGQGGGNGGAPDFMINLFLSFYAKSELQTQWIFGSHGFF